MCGLIGLAGNITFKEEKIFTTLLMLDVIRGKHSTGVASLHKDINTPVVKVVKDKLNAVDFMDLASFRTLMWKKHYILMGHNRWATKGAIVQENAHPFEFDNIVGAHNGSLNSQLSFHEGNRFAVDSQALYSELNHSDAATMWSKTNGAAALSWIDKRDNSLNFLRNKERPLWFTTINKGETLVWASEHWMIHVACSREGFALDEAPREVALNTLYTFPIEMKIGAKITYNRTEVEPYVAPKWESRPYSRTYDSYANDGKKHLEMEGAKEGDEVEFTISKIRDYMDNGSQRASIEGDTLKKNPVRIYHIDSIQYDDLLLEMWETDGMVFTGKIKWGTYAGLVLDVTTIKCTGYTLEDIETARAALKGEMEKKREEQRDKGPTGKFLPKGTTFKKTSWKMSCSYCRTLVGEYYLETGALACCTRCWDSFEKLAQEQVKDAAKLH